MSVDKEKEMNGKKEEQIPKWLKEINEFVKSLKQTKNTVIR